MKVVQEKAPLVEKVLGKQAGQAPEGARFLTYCVAAPCAEGLLLYNVLTKEMLLLDRLESDGIDADELSNSLILKQTASEPFQYLYDNYFIVPQSNDDKELCLSLRTIARELLEVESEGTITGYTILTTTDCNARCFYCYEKGTRRQPMSVSTAHRVVDFIKAHCGGRKVMLSWFGGEPLLNTSPIDIISQDLRSAGIDYTAQMITNGSLFDETLIAAAKDLWNLHRVQITLDGTEELYNRRKAYIHSEGSPFKRVLDNIERLLKADIRVSIRLNMDEENCSDLSALIDYLQRCFGQYKKFRVYVALLSSNSGDELYGGASMEKVSKLALSLRQQLREANLSTSKRLTNKLRTSACMADNPSSLVIQTDGTLTKCQHYYDSRPCGNLHEGVNDMQEIAYWTRRDADTTLCDRCPLYPDCCRIAACQSAYNSPCKEVAALSHSKQAELIHSMLKFYKLYKQ